ncbi:hypothetical protein Tco_1049873 [Tanacetum coccineum]
MTTQSFRCKTCAHIHTTVSEVIKKAYIQSFRIISENQCLLQILKVIMIGRRYIIKAFKDSNRYEHVRLKISVWQRQSERRSQSNSEKPLSSLDDPPNSNFFVHKHDLVKKAITVPRTTRTQLLRDPNKLYVDDIRFDLKGWELFFKENFFCSITKRNNVKTCTAYMLYYLAIRRKFNFTSMIIYRIEEVINKRKGPMPFAMLLTRLYNYILDTNPQAIALISRFTFHEHVMDPIDISRNPSKEKGKKVASPSVITSSSSSSDDNEAPSFLEFYDKLSDNEDLTKAQREKRGLFKCLNRYVGTLTEYLEKQK